MGLLSGLKQEDYRNYEDGYGGYQFTSLEDIINYFMAVYVGENKVIPKASRTDVAFHAQRALQELSFDTFKSIKSEEIAVPSTLQMTLPWDYVNYTKISRVDSAGIKHLLYPTDKTSNPKKYQVDSNDDYIFNEDGDLMPDTNLITNGDFSNDTGWTIASGTGTAWTIGDYIDVDAGGTGVNHTYKNVLKAGAGASGYVSTPASDIIEGRRYKITFDVVIPSTGLGAFVLANATTNKSTLNSNDNDNNVDLIDSSSPERNVIGTHSVEWVQGSGNTGQIRLFTNASFDGVIDNVIVTRVGGTNDSTTWSNYSSATPSENQDDYIDDTYWPMDGERYGLDPQHAQANGSFYIDNLSGKIHFSSNISGKTVILDYISDSLGTDGEMQVHKFAEEAMYKWISHAILSTSSYGQQLVPRLTKEKFAAVRKAKLRLSNIKLEELTQILRGKSKQIKH